MDDIFKALSDPTRRAVLDHLHAKNGASLQDIEAALVETGFVMTRFGVMKHLTTLENAHLVVSRKVGRYKYHYLNMMPLQEALDRWARPLLERELARKTLNLKSDLEIQNIGDNTMTTSPKPDFVLETFIRTTPEKLWAALTDPDQVARYHFAGCRPDHPFEVGQQVKFITPDGAVMLGHKVISSQPSSRLELTFEPGWVGDDVPASRCVYEITRDGDHCKLTILHFDLPAEQGGVREGWSRIASSIKTLLETGEAVRFTSNQAA